MAWHVRIKLLEADVQGAPVGQIFELYRQEGQRVVEKQYCSQWLCSLITAITGQAETWQESLATLMNAGDLTTQNFVVRLTQTYGSKINPKTGQPYVNQEFSHV
jgi:hypothetical protein